MKIILIQDVANLGEEGDIKDVAAGYARNFLLPRKKALPYNTANLNILEQKKASIERRKEEKKEAAKSLKEKIEQLIITLEMPAGENGKLFGAVTAGLLAENMEKQGLTVEKKKIEIPEPIKAAGKHKATVKLYGGEIAEFNIEVTPVAKT